MLVGRLWLWFTSGWAGVVVWRRRGEVVVWCRRVEVVVRMWREEVVVGRGSWSIRGKSVGLGWRGNCAKREGRNGGAKWEGRSGCVKGKMVKSWREGLAFCRKGKLFLWSQGKRAVCVATRSCSWGGEVGGGESVVEERKCEEDKRVCEGGVIKSGAKGPGLGCVVAGRDGCLGEACLWS